MSANSSFHRSSPFGRDFIKSTARWVAVPPLAHAPDRLATSLLLTLLLLFAALAAFSANDQADEWYPTDESDSIGELTPQQQDALEMLSPTCPQCGTPT